LQRSALDDRATTAIIVGTMASDEDDDDNDSRWPVWGQTYDMSGDDGSHRGERRPACDNSATVIITGMTGLTTVAVRRQRQRL